MARTGTLHAVKQTRVESGFRRRRAARRRLCVPMGPGGFGPFRSQRRRRRRHGDGRGLRRDLDHLALFADGRAGARRGRGRRHAAVEPDRSFRARSGLARCHLHRFFVARAAAIGAGSMAAGDSGRGAAVDRPLLRMGADAFAGARSGAGREYRRVGRRGTALPRRLAAFDGSRQDGPARGGACRRLAGEIRRHAHRCSAGAVVSVPRQRKLFH